MHWYEHNAEVMVTDTEADDFCSIIHTCTPQKPSRYCTCFKKQEDILIMLPEQVPDTLQFFPSKHENQHILGSQHLS